MNEPGEPRQTGRRPRATARLHPVDAASAPPVGLAVWVSPEQHAELVAAVQDRIHRSPRSAVLPDVRLELDAAAVRSRWFDTREAARLRRTAGWCPGAIELRVNQAEREALLTCELSPALHRAVVGPALPAPPTPPARATSTEPDEASLGASTEPVALLTEQGGHLVWTVGVVAQDDTVLALQPPPDDDAIWAAAWQAARRLPVEIEELSGARRLTTPAHPALATAALARTDPRSLPTDSVVLLRLPDVVAVAPPMLASRIALHAYPVRVHASPLAALPPYPLA